MYNDAEYLASVDRWHQYLTRCGANSIKPVSLEQWLAIEAMLARNIGVESESGA